ncbi:hypothetical protein [Liquorilactobacillus hordei]|uniref:Uncharacterized protein n=1 Tax=Liquorilactobacillus hordei DSM 19519 TaxID=1423759 RepID=A0A0R1MUF7_9LACO|nr:hypothetical protein [Liquorilactobacillus hordei]KRL08035.1 hypothetical protein FC92_GL001108 [Liquorilactobacillus hordei DSM 19519]QYH51021.1 hypothetical protein G6O70_00200 [Liquorilactobacillus hordei DSM 19519]
MKKKYKSKVDMLEAFRKEIYRLEIQDNPSRTEYQNRYDKKIAPSPNYLMKVLELNWREIIKFIGLEYKPYLNNENKLGRKEIQYNWEEVEAKICKLVFENKIKNNLEFSKILKKENFPTSLTLAKHGITWKKIIFEVNDKYNTIINSNIYYKDSDGEELVRIAKKIIKKNNIQDVNDYIKMGRNEYPSINMIGSKLNITRTAVINLLFHS